jgi:hypothetical protein
LNYLLDETEDPRLLTQLEMDDLVEYVENGAISKGTLNTYKGPWKEWVMFNVKRGKDDPYLNDLDLEPSIQLVCLFLLQVRKSGGNQTKVNRALCAIKYFMSTALANTEFLNDPAITRTVNACKDSGYEISEKKEQNVRLPVTKDMIQFIKQKYHSHNDIDKRLAYLGVMLGFHFMLRASEYIFDNSQSRDQHAIRAKDVSFNIQEVNSYYNKMSWDLNESHIQHLESANIILRTSKTSRRGQACHLFLNRKGGIEEMDLLIALARVMKDSEVTNNDPLMCRYKDGRRRLLRRIDVQNLLVEAADHFQLNNKNFTLHSLRSGGATSQRAAGASKDDVDRRGRWVKNSQSSDIYYCRTSLEGGTLTSSLDNRGEFTTEALRSRV